MVASLIIDSFHINSATYKEYSQKTEAIDALLQTNKDSLQQNKDNQDIIKKNQDLILSQQEEIKNLINKLGN